MATILKATEIYIGTGNDITFVADSEGKLETRFVISTFHVGQEPQQIETIFYKNNDRCFEFVNIHKVVKINGAAIVVID